MMPFKILLILSTLLGLCEAAFLSSQNHATTAFQRHPTNRSTKQTLQLFDEASDFSSVANNILLATIDSDIANIPDNEFGLVFAGGIVVMAGGVLSALIVGFILEKGDLYSSVAAESYLQSADDEEFWKGLSEEERKKTEEVLAKIKASKEGTSIDPVVESEPAVVAADAVVDTSSRESSPSQKTEETTKSQPSDMFSDY